MGMEFAPTWLLQVSPPPLLLHKTTLTTGVNEYHYIVVGLTGNGAALTLNNTVYDNHFRPGGLSIRVAPLFC